MRIVLVGGQCKRDGRHSSPPRPSASLPEQFIFSLYNKNDHKTGTNSVS